MRTPIDMDEFNRLGSNPEANEEALSKLVGTKFKDIKPTQVTIESPRDVKSEATETVTPKVEGPKSKAEMQAKIDELDTKISNEKDVLKRIALQKEQKALISERDSIRKMFDSNAQHEDKGQKVTIDEAITEIRRLLPNIQPHEIEFLNKSLMKELENPGESLLGLYNKGRISLLDDEGVYGNVVRHEVFHKVFNDYLSDRERRIVMDAFDPEGKMNPTDLEETLADKFAIYKKAPETFSGKIKRLFNRIASWLGFADANKDVVKDLFNKIEEGKFQKPDAETTGTRMAFSDIAKWGTVKDYKDASRFLQKHIYDHFVDDNIANDVHTQDELFNVIAKDLKDKVSETQKIINNDTKDRDELNNLLLAEEPGEKRDALLEAVDSLNNDLVENTSKLNKLQKLTTGATLREMWKDIYPNFRFKGEAIVFDEHGEYDEHASEFETNTLYSNFIQSADEKDQQSKISENVKNFLSFIYRPQSGERINPKGVYLQSLRNLRNMDASHPDFLEPVSYTHLTLPTNREV